MQNNTNQKQIQTKNTTKTTNQNKHHLISIRMSVSSSTALADHAANTLMAAAARSVGAHDAARAFWYRTFRQAWAGFCPRNCEVNDFLPKKSYWNHILCTFFSQWLVCGLCWWFTILGKNSRTPTLTSNQPCAEIATHKYSKRPTLAVR